MLSSLAIYWNRSLTFVKSTFALFSSIFYHVLQPILITFCQPIDPFWNDIFQLQTAQEVVVWWSLSDNRGESGYRRRYSWLHARHFIFHARVPIVPSWQQFRLSYCVAWFLLIPRWLEWSGQSQHNCSDYYKIICNSHTVPTIWNWKNSTVLGHFVIQKFCLHELSNKLSIKMCYKASLTHRLWEI